MNDSVLAKGGCSKEVIYRLPIDGKPRLSISKHDSPDWVYSQKVTHIAYIGPAVSTIPTLPCKYREYMIPYFKV